MPRSFFPAVVAALIALGLCLPVSADPPSEKGPSEKGPAENAAPGGAEGRPNLALPTLGGKQFWVDRRLLHGWRIQEHVGTGHFRLLDEKNRRQAWGTYEACDAKLEAVRRERQWAPMRGTAVIVVHGLFRSRGSLVALADEIRGEGETTVLTFGYPTTRGTVAEHANSLAQVMGRLEEIDEVHFVGHSLGNVVIRHYLGDRARAAAGGAKQVAHPKVGRFVMLGPPNHGATIAEKLVPLDASGQIVGAAAGEIARGWEKLAPRLATPPGEFGIVAGGRGDDRGYNPLIPGDDDMVVSVKSARLAGARDFRRLPVVHTTMMNDTTVRALTRSFLKHGYFESDEKRQPIDVGEGAREDD